MIYRDSYSDRATGASITFHTPLPLSRSSTLCSAARGAAVANPKRDDRMMVERMAMRTCEKFEWKKRLLGDLVVVMGEFIVSTLE